MLTRHTTFIDKCTVGPLEQGLQLISAGSRYIMLSAAMLLSIPTSAGAQTLSFGATGAGGTGPWNNTSTNWFNGSTAVPWTSGSTAAFGGAAGTVTVNGTVGVGGATFSTSGYTVTGGTLGLTGTAPTFTTNTAISAAINSLITGSAPLVKTGGGTLTIGNGNNTYSGGTTVSQGSLVFGGNNALGTGTITLGDAATGASNVSLLANFANFLSPQKIANNIVVSGSGTGTVTIGSTSFNVGSNGTLFSGTVTLNRDVTITSGNVDRTSFTGKITGTGNITITGSRVSFDGAGNDFLGDITVNAGSVLQTNIANSLPRTATLNILGNGVLQFANTADQTIDGLNGSSAAIIRIIVGGRPNLTLGAANGSGAFAGQIQNVISSLTKLGTGTQVLSGANTYAGVTKISGGVLSTQLLANGGAASGIGASSNAAANLVLDGGMLQYTGSGASTNRQFTLTTNGGGIDASGSGALNFTSTTGITLSGTGARSLTLTGTNTATNTLAATLGNNGGTSSLIKAGTGTWLLSGSNSYTGGTFLNGGTLVVANDGNLGAASGPLVFDGGTLENTGAFATSRNVRLNAGGGTFQTDADLTVSGLIDGAGALTKTGGAALILSGANTYSGATTVASGSLIVNGDQSAATGLTTVQNGATIGGTGTIGGSVVVASGGTLNPGNPGAVPGTLAINGDLTLNSGSALNYNFGQANIAGGALNDLTKVGGNLTLDGTLDVTTTPGGTFSPGVYRVISYSGALTNNGLTVGTVPSPNFFLQTSVANQVNLVNTDGLTLRFWDGAGNSSTKNDGVIQGGDGVWQNPSGNDFWTTEDGTPNAPYTNSAFAVFQGAPGTVTVDNGLGQVQASGMQFATNGYHLIGNAIELTGAPQSIVRVGDGTSDGAAYVATIDNALTGNTELVKTDLGTLVLNGSNTYAGGTAIQGGTIRISSDGNLGGSAGGLTLDGGTLETTTSMTSARGVLLASTGTLLTDAGTTLMLTGSLSGAGSVTKAGSGTLLLTGTGSQTGDTIVAGGTLQTGAANVLSPASAMTVQSGAALNLNGFAQTIPSLTNAGTVTLGTTPGTALTVNGNYTGAGGTVRLNAALGGDSSQTDRLVVTGDTAGDTTLRVSNVGGAGGQTVNGIQVVTVNGASNGTFALQGDYVVGGQQAVIGGAYAYTLQKNGIATPNDGNWYLRSSLVNAPTASNTLYQPGAPLYEAYPQALLALNGLPTLQQRAGNRYWNDATPASASSTGTSFLPLWARIEGQHQTVNPSTSTTGTRWSADQTKLQMGLDGVLMESDAGRLFAGITAQYGRASNDVRSFFGNGNIGVSGYSIGGTATWAAQNDFYIDAQAQVTWYDSDLTSDAVGQRMVNGNKGFGQAFGIEAGQRLAVNDTWSITPQAQLVYSSVRFDGFNDRYGARVNLDKGESLTSRLGVSLDHNAVWNNGAGQIARSTFYGVANLYYEFMGDTRVDLAGVPLSERPDRLWGGIGVGGTVNWKDDRYAVYGELLVKTSLENPGDSHGYQGTVGVRARW